MIANVLVALATQDARLLAMSERHAADINRMDRLQNQIDKINRHMSGRSPD